MNASTMSEDQVLTQLTMPSSRHVRFDLPSFSGHTQPETAGPSTPVRPLPVPYVAPIPPSSIHMQQPNNSDPAAKVRNYLETVVIPRGGECTEVEVLGLSMLLQSTVPGTQLFWGSLTLYEQIKFRFTISFRLESRSIVLFERHPRCIQRTGASETHVHNS